MDWLIVEVVIGLSFLFFLLSIVASAVSEAIAGIFKLRARVLEQGIVNLVTGSTKPAASDQSLGIVRDLYNSPLILGYGTGSGSKPSYLASRSFRNALFDVTGLLEATAEPTGDPLRASNVTQAVDDKIKSIEGDNLQRVLGTLWRSAEHDATKFREAVERWFDRAMERVSGWYKRRTQLLIFIVGVGLAAAVNANALWVADRLWKDDSVRKMIVAEATTSSSDVTPQQAVDQIEKLDFPVGWSSSNRAQSGTELVVVAAGWILTGFGVSFGAPFWFDLLGKFANLRNAGKKPASTLPDEPPPPS